MKLLFAIILCTVAVNAQTPPKETTPAPAEYQKAFKETLAAVQQAEREAQPLIDRLERRRAEFMQLIFRAEAELGKKPAETGWEFDKKGEVVFFKLPPKEAAKVVPPPKKESTSP